MSKYAIVKIAGVQYKITEGQEVLVNKLSADPEITVLLSVNEDQVQVGHPYLKNIQVKTKNLGEVKGEKIDVIKFKAKSRYRKKIGFRPQYTRLLIQSISSKN